MSAPSRTPIHFRAMVRLAVPAAALALLAACAPRPEAPQVHPAVYVTAVRTDAGAAERVLFGTVRPRVETELAFRTGGKVSARLVELGQTVRAGQPLARIDPADYALSVQAAAAQQRAAAADATQAAADAQRYRQLQADGFYGPAAADRQHSQAEAAAARLAQAQRQLELARNRAGYTVLPAPFDGIVTAVRFESGQVVGEGQPVVTLARPGELEVQADVPEDLAPALADWQATVRLGNGAPVSVPLRLRELAPSASPQTRTYRARFALAAPAGMPLRLGMTAEVRLQRADAERSAELPVAALVTDAGPPSVWRVDAATGTLTRQPVRLLAQTAEAVRVAGLADGALVVSAGAHKLDAGMTVRPVPRPLAEVAAR
jgi:RND family efflux transporter MFP subunit